MRAFVLLVPALFLVVACSTTVNGGGACTTNADCAADGICGFVESDGCSAAGVCFDAPGATCTAYSPGCACDGTEISIICTGLPEGYASKPLAHKGVCGDADAGPGTDAGACCPSDWSMYGCTYPDGSSGYACHNPAMGCASSSTCGEGCDTVVVGVCATDAGACCPADWSMYPCTYPNGSSGYACHNPAMGCASSSTCGEGCDTVVLGVCGG